MDQELKQRIIGAAVVTALAAIFVPMLFDDPVDDRSQAVTELTIPQSPVAPVDPANDKLPADAGQVPDQAVARAGAEAPQDKIYSEPVDAEVVTEDSLPEDTEEREETPVSPSKAAVTAPKAQPQKPASNKPEPMPEPKKPATVAKDKVVPNKPVMQEKPATADTQKLAAPAVKQQETKPAEAGKPAVGALQRWYLRVGSFSKEENAVSLWSALRKQGFPAALETVVVDSKTLYRLKVGPELDQKRAAAMKEKIDKQNNTNSILVSE